MNSSIDRRVLDEEHPASSQSTRDRQSIQNWPGRTLFTPSPEPGPVISIESISSVACKHNAIRPAARLTVQLEARPGTIGIFSNSSSHLEPMTEYYPLRALKPVEQRLPVFTFVASVGGDIN